MIHEYSNSTMVFNISYVVCVNSLVIVVMLFGLGVFWCMVICSIVGAYVLWY
jgi:hypothetical protein